jgi:ABC-2 type transport system ATP-binding protein
MVAGVSVPSAGRVTGRPHTGYVPERFPGGLAFPAREYLIHLGKIHGLRGPSAMQAVDEWLDRLGAADYAGSPLRSLSKGMCQKVAIAQALLSRPGLLVLDEAWTGLDQAARAALDTAVLDRLADGGTVMFVDHQHVRLAGRVSQRWLVGAGKVRVLDGPEESAAGSALEESAETVVIEVSGLDSELMPLLAGLAGVRRTQPVTHNEGNSAGRVQVTASADTSDAVLRQLLGWDGVHVLAVRPGPRAAS